MKYLKVSNKLYLVEQEIQSKTQIEKRKSVNHIFIYDRSWSMSREIKTLCDHLIALVQKIPKGDTVTIGYFATEGTYNFILKGFKISEDSDYSLLRRVVNDNNTTIGLTCYSEILKSTETVINDLSVFSDVFSLHFFSDGYTVTKNRREEHQNIFTNIAKISGKISSAVICGYGHYYNKDLLAKMAEKIGGVLIHSDCMHDYDTSLNQLLSLSTSVDVKKEIMPIDCNSRTIFSVTDNGIMLYSCNNGKLYVTPQSGKNTKLYYLTTKPYGNEVNYEHMLEGVYGAILVLMQQASTNTALEIAGKLGDVNIINAITNSFTLSEYGKTTTKIEKCIYNSNQRFINGKDVNYLPPKDAYCVLQLIQDLMEDDSCKFYPYHPKFKYKTVSAKVPTAKGYAPFKEDDNVSVSFSSLVYHKDRLNISIRTKPTGTVRLRKRGGKSAKDFGLVTKYPVSAWRSFTFISDGLINFNTLYMTSSKEMYDTLHNLGLVVDDTFQENKIYGLSILNIPVINRGMGENISAITLCESLIAELYLEAEAKVYKYFLTNDYPEDKIVSSVLTEQAIEFLEDNGIKKGIYNPKTDSSKTKTTDYNVVTRFRTKISKYSSFPKVGDVIDRISKKSNQTTSGALMVSYINEYRKNDTKVWLEEKIAKNKDNMFSIRRIIQGTKSALILGGNNWFTEFSNREENSISHRGFDFEFAIDQVEVKI